MTDIVDSIDQAIGCQQCGKSLDASPSVDFCSEQCQQRWHEKRSVALTDSAFSLYHVARYGWAGLLRPARGGTIPPRTTTPEETRLFASTDNGQWVEISRREGDT